MNRSARIITLLVIDGLFFFVELIVGKHDTDYFRPVHPAHPCTPGYAVGSLALVADSFHMLKYALRTPLCPDHSSRPNNSAAMS